MIQKFEIVGESEPCDVSPIKIYRVLGEERMFRDSRVVTVDDYVDDPAVGEFFLVLKKVESTRVIHESKSGMMIAYEPPKLICFYRGQFVVCTTLLLGFKGDSTLAAGAIALDFDSQNDVFRTTVAKFGRKLMQMKKFKIIGEGHEGVFNVEEECLLEVEAESEEEALKEFAKTDERVQFFDGLGWFVGARKLWAVAI
jgi:hypothetical protein